MDKAFILNFLATHKKELKDRFGLVKIGLFGSYVRDEQTKDSDIDLVVEIESKNKFRSFFGIKQYLEENLHHKVDIGIESTLKPLVKKSIENEIKYV